MESTHPMRYLTAFLMDDSGQGLVEYALILALVSIIAVAALNYLGQRANNSLNSAGAQMPG